jgi:hypothetical protein
MRSVARTLALVVALAITSVTMATAQAADPPQPDAAQSDRRILVMLRMAPQHFRPDSAYGGRYGDGEGRSARWRAALRLARDQGVTLVDEWPMPLVGVDCFVMVAPPGQSPEIAATRLARDPGVSWSEPMHTYRGQGAPTHNDPLYRVQPVAREWDLAELHKISTGRNVRVAVIDSMIEESHPDLAGQVEVMQNFVPDRPAAPEDHGTGVAGIIAARADNGLGIAGVAPQARLMGLRACWQEPPKSAAAAAVGAPTVCDSLSLAKALEFAIDHRAQVINMSLSGPSDVLLGRLLDVAVSRDVAVVAAYDRNLPVGGFPASHKGVVAVIDESSGPPVPGAFGAPGRDVPTTEPGGRWFLVNGSSYAAAHVSGLFALMRQRAPRLHSGAALVFARSGNTIDACATLLQKAALSQKAGACDCNCVHPREQVANAVR